MISPWLALSIIVGSLGSVIVLYAGYRKGGLTREGLLAGILVGFTTGALGSYAWWLLLVAFFLSSTALTMYKAKAKAIFKEKFQKTGRRDAYQVFANGGPGSLAAIALALSNLLGNPTTKPLMAFFVGTMASVTADTWATELGVLSKRNPRLIIGFQEVEKGTSGAVSPLGELATVLASLFIGFLALVFSFLPQSALYPASFIHGVVGGVAGCTIDSLMGATIQGFYKCQVCGKETEKPIHCGAPAKLLRGSRKVGNDLVNFTSSTLAGLICALLSLTAGI